MARATFRVKPGALAGVGLWVLYLVIAGIIQATSGIPYTEWGNTAGSLWRGASLSILVGGGVVATVAIGIGWFGAAMRDAHRSTARWTLIAPVLYLLVVLGTLLLTEWSRVSAIFLVSALALGVLVGFAEELVCRGVLLVGLRGTFTEVWVWLVSCALFGAMHGINIVLGQAAGITTMQMLSAAVQGSALYILRRVTGSLVPAMALHGLWDFSILVNVHSGAGPSLLTLLGWAAGILAIVGGLVVARRSGREGSESYAVGAPRPAPRRGAR